MHNHKESHLTRKYLSVTRYCTYMICEGIALRCVATTTVDCPAVKVTGYFQ